MKKYISVMFFLFSAYILLIYNFQNKFLFQPEKHYKSPHEADTAVFTENKIKTEDGTDIMTWYFQGDPAKPAIFFFHGNTGQIAKFAPDMIPFTETGHTVVMSEYRGFGGTPGFLNQQNVFDDAKQIYDFYKNKLKYSKVIFYGYSFGCAVVAGLTQYRIPDGIILTAPFTSFYREVKDKFIPFASYLLKDKYPSDEYLKNIICPVLLIHGKKDKTISYKHSHELYKIIPAKEKEIVINEEDNHHDIYFEGKNLQAIKKWLNSHFNAQASNTVAA